MGLLDALRTLILVEQPILDAVPEEVRGGMNHVRRACGLIDAHCALGSVVQHHPGVALSLDVLRQWALFSNLLIAAFLWVCHVLLKGRGILKAVGSDSAEDVFNNLARVSVFTLFVVGSIARVYWYRHYILQYGSSIVKAYDMRVRVGRGLPLYKSWGFRKTFHYAQRSSRMATIQDALEYAYQEYDMEPSEEAEELGRLVADLQD